MDLWPDLRPAKAQSPASISAAPTAANRIGRTALCDYDDDDAGADGHANQKRSDHPADGDADANLTDGDTPLGNGTFSETRVLTREDLSQLDTLRHAPIIVQEKIEKGADVFGAAVFAAEVSINVPQADLDWRIDSTAPWHHHDLPDAVGCKLKALLKVLDLQYGCIDCARSRNC